MSFVVSSKKAMSHTVNILSFIKETKLRISAKNVIFE